MFELDSGITSGETPVYSAVSLVSLVLPSLNLLLQGLLVGNSAVEALAREDTKLNFGHVEPTAMPGGVVEL